jgi:hypothetical protein
MKVSRFVGIMAVTMLASGVLQSQVAQAQIPYAKKANKYAVDMARAMDECTSNTVVGSGNTCPQANSTTDSSVTGAIKARLTVYHSGQGVKVRLSGHGFTPGASRIGVKLTLRTTNKSSVTHDSRTYADTPVICGPINDPSPGCHYYFASNAAGNVSGVMYLGNCFTEADNLPVSNLGIEVGNLNTGNIEIVDATLINCSTGDVIAVPGVLQ